MYKGYTNRFVLHVISKTRVRQYQQTRRTDARVTLLSHDRDRVVFNYFGRVGDGGDGEMTEETFSRYLSLGLTSCARCLAVNKREFN